MASRRRSRRARAGRLEAKRRARAARAPAGKATSKSPTPYVLAGLGVGLGVWLLTRSSQAAPMGPGMQTGSYPSLPAPASTGAGGTSGAAGGAGGSGGSGGATYNTSMSDVNRLATLYSRLRGDANAQAIYAFQALMYQANFTNAVPDGLMGPVTTAMIQSIQQRDSLPVTGTFDTSLFAAIQDVTGWSSSTAYTDMRQLPDTLPDDIVTALDQVVQTADPSWQGPIINAYMIPAAPTSGPSSSFTAYNPSALAPVG